MSDFRALAVARLMKVGNWNLGLHHAVIGRHYDLILQLIEKGANDFNNMLQQACYLGYRDIASLAISKGATSNWNNELAMACSNGHRDIVLLMIDQGANNWNTGLHCADMRRHRELVILMITKGADIDYSHLFLSDNEIMQLVQLGHKKFGTYERRAKACRQIILERQQQMNAYLIRDLSSIIVKY